MAELSKTGKYSTLGSSGRNAALGNTGRISALGNTNRLRALGGGAPIYLAGETVYLLRETQGFPRSTKAKIIAAYPDTTGRGAGMHRYQLLIDNTRVWVIELDVRSTPPTVIQVTGAHPVVLSSPEESRAD